MAESRELVSDMEKGQRRVEIAPAATIWRTADWWRTDTVDCGQPIRR